LLAFVIVGRQSDFCEQYFSMPKGSFDRRQPGHVVPPSTKATSSGASLVEEIWSSWCHEKVVTTSSNAPSKAAIEPPESRTSLPARAASAERVSGLKRRGEYERALEIALSEIEREEAEWRSCATERPSVPWFYWEAASIYRQLKRHSDEIALIRRFAKNHDIHFRAFSKRYRSTRGATHAWATKFLERIETARAAAIAREDGKQNRT
jgi:hypothetical protein